MKVRVLVAEDQDLFRDGLVALLRTCPELEVVGAASNGLDAVEASIRLRPDVVLMDLKMPALDGTEAIRRLTAHSEVDARVLVLTTFADQDSVRSALKAGAVGYLMKDVSRQRLLEGILAAARGHGPLSDQVAAHVIRAVAGDDGNTPAPPYDLTPREREVIAHLGKGLPNRQIAAVMQISEGTVKNHLTRVFEKLGVDDRTQAVLRALELELLPRRR